MTTREHRPLGRALEEAAEGVTRTFAARTAAGTGIDVQAVRASARRRRARFGAGVGAVGAAVVAVTLLAAGALQGADDPAPPAQTNTPSPTAEELDITPAPGSGLACGARLDALPAQPEGAPEASLELSVADPTIRVGDPIEAYVTTTVVMDVSLPYSYTFGIWLVRDSVVVGRPEPDWADEGRPSGSREDANVEARVVRARFLECGGDGATPVASGGSADFDLVAVLDGVQVDGGPVSAPFLSNLVTVHVGGSGTDPATQGDEWIAAFVGDEGWRDVDPGDVPGDLPLTLDDADEVIQSQAYEDGLRWRVTVSHADGLDAYERARDALVASGYALEDERADPDRPFWSAATLTRGAVIVRVETSNETGGGFYSTFLVQGSW